MIAAKGGAGCLAATLAAMSAIGCYAVRLDALVDRGLTSDVSDASGEGVDASREPDAPDASSEGGTVRESSDDTADALPSWCPAGSLFETEPNGASNVFPIDKPAVICGVVRGGDEDHISFPFASAGPIARVAVERVGGDSDATQRVRVIIDDVLLKDIEMVPDQGPVSDAARANSRSARIIVSESDALESRYVVRLSL